MAEIRAATLEELRNVRESLEALQRLMPKQVEEKVAEVSVPRQELRRTLQRWWVAGLLIMLLVVAASVITNRVTLLAAQHDLTNQVTTCFLRPGAITPAQAAACDRRFGNDSHAYLKLQEQSRQATKRFADLQRWAQSQGWEPPQ